MSRVARRESLALENVAQMGVAGGAPNLDAESVRIGKAPHRSGKFLIEAWPSAAAVELVAGPVELRAAAPALVAPGRKEVVVLPRERRLGPATDDDGLLLTGKASPRAGGALDHAKEALGGSLP